MTFGHLRHGAAVLPGGRPPGLPLGPAQAARWPLVIFATGPHCATQGRPPGPPL